MVSSTFDPNSFKMSQREGWDSVAGGWKEWWVPIEKGTGKTQSAINRTCWKRDPHERVLDITKRCSKIHQLQQQKLSEPEVMF